MRAKRGKNKTGEYFLHTVGAQNDSIRWPKNLHNHSTNMKLLDALSKLESMYNKIHINHNFKEIKTYTFKNRKHDENLLKI